jgi:hypothetical protein
VGIEEHQVVRRAVVRQIDRHYLVAVHRRPGGDRKPAQRHSVGDLEGLPLPPAVERQGRGNQAADLLSAPASDLLEGDQVRMDCPQEAAIEPGTRRDRGPLHVETEEPDLPSPPLLERDRLDGRHLRGRTRVGHRAGVRQPIAPAGLLFQEELQSGATPQAFDEVGGSRRLEGHPDLESLGGVTGKGQIARPAGGAPRSNRSGVIGPHTCRSPNRISSSTPRPSTGRPVAAESSRSR